MTMPRGIYLEIWSPSQWFYWKSRGVAGKMTRILSTGLTVRFRVATTGGH